MEEVAVWRGDDPAERVELQHYTRTLCEKIRTRAFELFEARGGAGGQALDDWLKAEREILGCAAIDVLEDNEHLWVRIGLPGFRPEDIDVHVFPNMICCHAESHHSERTRGVKFYSQELAAKHLYREIALPHEILVETAHASLENGILELAALRKRPALKAPEERLAASASASH